MLYNTWYESFKLILPFILKVLPIFQIVADYEPRRLLLFSKMRLKSREFVFKPLLLSIPGACKKAAKKLNLNFSQEEAQILLIAEHPSKFFSAIQSYLSRLSVGFPLYNGRSTLIRLDGRNKFGRAELLRTEVFLKTINNELLENVFKHGVCSLLRQINAGRNRDFEMEKF